MPLNKNLKKVMVIGSGPIVIGQAAEFDYAGTQACRALKQAGLEVVLVNSNPATIMTDNAMADEIYLEPLNLPTIKRIIEKEKPDSLLSTLGGQTGLTLSMQLAKEGFLEKHGVTLLGAKTAKHTYGHRGANQPVKEFETDKIYITSQNHGYIVDEATLPSDAKVSFVNVNDKTVEGIECTEKKIITTQFMPNNCKGPHNTEHIIKKFVSIMKGDN